MNFNPFVRCVGIGSGIYQKNETKAYDHRLIVILKGYGKIRIDRKMYETSPCELYLIKPGTSYRVCCGEDQEISVINFDTGYENAHLIDPILSVDASHFDPSDILDGDSDCPVGGSMRVENDDLLLLYRMYGTYLREDLGAETKSFCLTSQLLYLASRALLCERDGKPGATSSAIYKYVIENAYGKITVGEVARTFNYSTSFVEKSLRTNFGLSFKQLVIETRLKRSLWLLENTELSCAQIAAELGFSSGQHFSSTFMKKYGKRPSFYR